MKLYILEGKNAVRCNSVSKWGDSFERPPGNLVKLDYVDDVSKLRVSTIFLGLDLSDGRSTEPILFETMVFDRKGPIDRYSTRRCSTYDQAVAQHNEVLAQVRKDLS